MGEKVNHPIRNQTFELLDDGTIKVEDHDARTEGVFTRAGRHLAGDLGFADPQMLNWIGGKAETLP